MAQKLKKENYEICLEVNLTLAGRHQRNHHAGSVIIIIAIIIIIIVVVVIVLQSSPVFISFTNFFLRRFHISILIHRVQLQYKNT